MIVLDDLNLSLDRKEKGANLDFVSHAHSDHISSIKSSKAVLSSKETKELLEAVHKREVYAAESCPDSLRMIDAGHMLGSKQIVIENERVGKKIIYTGDFQMQRSRACKPIQVEACDTVIVDSTYPYGDLIFEERTETEITMQKWAESRLRQGIVLFGTYALGKSQEIISIMNEVDIVPVVNRKISGINKVYTGNGVKLTYASSADEGSGRDELMRGNFVGIVEPHSLETVAAQLRHVYNKSVFTAVATGFSMMYHFNTDAQFALSDHADIKQAKEYIDSTGAKQVYTYGPSSEEFASLLQRNGYNAAPFSDIVLTEKALA